MTWSPVSDDPGITQYVHVLPLNLLLPTSQPHPDVSERSIIRRPRIRREVSAVDAEELYWARLADIHTRVNWLADREARAVSLRGSAVGFWEEKKRLLEEADAILDKLEEGIVN